MALGMKPRAARMKPSAALLFLLLLGVQAAAARMVLPFNPQQTTRALASASARCADHSFALATISRVRGGDSACPPL